MRPCGLSRMGAGNRKPDRNARSTDHDNAVTKWTGARSRSPGMPLQTGEIRPLLLDLRKLIDGLQLCD